MLKIRNLFYHSFGPVNLTVEKGECVGITGPSGIGKSLFLRAVADLDDHKGEISFEGTLSTEMTGPEWRRLAGLLPAESSWWYDTVGEHLGEVDKKLLAGVGFEPEVLEWEIRRLSTGERQRLALARLLSGNPKVLLLDEPTSSLDAANVEKVEQFLCRLRKEKKPAMIWVSHDLEQLKRTCSRCFRLDGGGFNLFHENKE